MPFVIKSLYLRAVFFTALFLFSYASFASTISTAWTQCQNYINTTSPTGDFCQDYPSQSVIKAQFSTGAVEAQFVYTQGCTAPQTFDTTTGQCTAPNPCGTQYQQPNGSCAATIPDCKAYSGNSSAWYNTTSEECVAPPQCNYSSDTQIEPDNLPCEDTHICIDSGTTVSAYCPPISDCLPVTTICSGPNPQPSSTSPDPTATKSAATSHANDAATASSQASSASTSKQDNASTATANTNAANQAVQDAVQNGLTGTALQDKINDLEAAIAAQRLVVAAAGNSAAAAAAAAASAAAAGAAANNSNNSTIPHNVYEYEQQAFQKLTETLQHLQDAISGIKSGTGTGEGDGQDPNGQGENCTGGDCVVEVKPSQDHYVTTIGDKGEFDIEAADADLQAKKLQLEDAVNSIKNEAGTLLSPFQPVQGSLPVIDLGTYPAGNLSIDLNDYSGFFNQVGYIFIFVATVLSFFVLLS